MAHLSIRNIGPIRDIDIELNRVNVFIGPQSSGKSTISKIISFCQWLEKDLVIRQGLEHVDSHLLVKILIKYHNMTDYFSADSEFHYRGYAINLGYARGQVNLERAPGFATAKVSKNAYIPAERNVVTLPGIAALEWPQFYLRNFLFDWLSIRSKFSREHALNLRNLGVSYYYRESDGENVLVLDSGKGREIHLDQASSGLQSATPLYVMLEYLTRWIYENEDDRSYEKQRKIDEGAARRIVEALMSAAEAGESDKALVGKLKSMQSSAGKPEFSNIVIEEPEQNLFPQTQAGLMQDILAMIDHKRDNLVITTHSPFILYALNNCMLAWAVRESIAAEKDDLDLDAPEQSWLDPASVSVWELRDGYIENYEGRRNATIQDADGLVRGNYFDRVMSNIMADFSTLIDFKD